MSEPSEAETTAITPSITLLINAICTRKNFQNVGELDWHEFVPFCHQQTASFSLLHESERAGKQRGTLMFTSM